MNIGQCPYDGCDGVFCLEVPDRTPAYAEIECEECKRPVWYKFSRVDPECWTKEDFERLHTIDMENRKIIRKDAPA